MADRGLRFDLIGRDKSLGSTLRKADRDTDRFSRNVGRHFDRAGDEGGRRFGMRLNKRLGGGFSASTAIVRKGAGAIGAAFAVAGIASFAKDSIDMAATFDKTMRQVAVATKTPTRGIKQLRETALDMGAKTSFSARQAGDAMLELAKGGLTFAEQKAGALDSTLTLAAAGGLELGEAAGFVVQGLKTFGLRADRAAEVSAALAGAANASTANVEDMGLALSQTGAGARNAGLSIQETTGVLAAFADNGIRGSDAGTSLKTMLQRLVPQTEKAKGAMEDLGLKFTDANGAMKPISNIAQQLQDRLGGLSDAERTTALQTIFGSDATRAATVLMREGSKGLATYIKATNDRAAAEKLAKTNTSGAAGALERLSGAVETARIRLGDKLLPVVADTAVKLAGIIDKITTLKPNLDKLNTAWNDNKDSLVALLTPFSDFNDKSQTADTRAQQLVDSMTTLTEGVGKVARGLKALGDDINAVAEFFNTAGEAIHVNFVRPMTESILGLTRFALGQWRALAGGAATLIEHMPGGKSSGLGKALRAGEQQIAALERGAQREFDDINRLSSGVTQKAPGGGKSGFGRSLGRAGEQMVRFRGQFNREVNGLHGKTVTVNAKAKVSLFQQTKSALLALGIKGYGTKFLAAGGQVRGPGTGTSDSVPAMLSAGEHVWTASEVKKAGGHGAVEQMRSEVRGYAAGGPVLDVRVAKSKIPNIAAFMDPAGRATSKLGGVAAERLASIIGQALGKAVEKGIGAGSAAIKAFIKSTDPLPYRWGAAGPGAYDCSGLVGAVYGKIRGDRRAGHGTRYFTTGTIGGTPGLKSGLGGVLNIGVTPGIGHMAGSYGGLNFEARSTATGIFTGSAARSPASFARRYHMARGGRVDRATLDKLARTPGVDIGGDAGGVRLAFGQTFDRGGTLAPGLNVVNNATGRPEPLVPAGQGIDYDRLGKAVAAALRENPPVTRVADVHAGLLAKRRSQGGMALGLG